VTFNVVEAHNERTTLRSTCWNGHWRNQWSNGGISKAQKKKE
jgi:hypothetical protein